MGIYYRVRHMAVTAVCVGGVAAGVLAAVPGDALAACKNTTASGSTLQTKQQETWDKKWSSLGSPKCSGKTVLVEYNKPKGTGSGQGLKEFGMPGEVLLPKESSNGSTLDGFIGTDDPPTEAQLLEAKKASEAWALTVPVVSAPVAAIVHLPESSCTIDAPKELNVTQKQINELWLGKAGGSTPTTLLWSETLKAWKYTVLSGCTQPVLHKVRSDGSGTSYAWKNWLCEVEGGKTKCPTWEEKPEILTDAAVWPKATRAETTWGAGKENKGSGGEIEAVAETPGSVGYVNYANAKSEPAGSPFTEYKTTAKKFWLKLEDAPSEFAEPGTPTLGNCPATLSATQKSELPTVLGGKDTAIWSNFHLSSTKVNETGTYPACTLTYDVSWESYLTTKLKEAGNYGSGSEETGETVKNYLGWVLEATGGQASGNLAEGFAKLPTEVSKKGTEAVTLIKP